MIFHAVLLLLGAASDVLAQNGVWGGINITQEVLQVANSISSPTCNATASCIQLTTQQVSPFSYLILILSIGLALLWISDRDLDRRMALNVAQKDIYTFQKHAIHQQRIPQCEALHDDPACWCGNVNPLHYCAICMSSPTDNSTNPQQTQNSLEGHINYHKGCAAWEAWLNGSLSSTSSNGPTSTVSMPLSTITSAASSSSSKSTNLGPIIGGAVGGVFVLIVIIGILFLIYRRMQNQHEQVMGQNRISVYQGGEGAAGDKYIAKLASPAPPSLATNARTPPPASSTAHYRQTQTPPHMVDPDFNPYFVSTLASQSQNQPTHATAASHPSNPMYDREMIMSTTGGGMTPAPMYQPSVVPYNRDSIATSTVWDSTTASGTTGSQGPMMVQNYYGSHGGLQTVPQGIIPVPPPPPHSTSPPSPPGAGMPTMYRPDPRFPNEKSQYQP